ncbi:hypothetical protein Droror1_Dr00019414, partial [Drosera rotundifolia]
PTSSTSPSRHTAAVLHSLTRPNLRPVLLPPRRHHTPSVAAHPITAVSSVTATNCAPDFGCEGGFGFECGRCCGDVVVVSYKIWVVFGEEVFDGGWVVEDGCVAGFLAVLSWSIGDEYGVGRILDGCWICV